MAKIKRNPVIRLNSEAPRLINILAELCQCDPANIEWDGEGSSDTIAFKTESCRYLLKLAKESVQGKSADTMDFRIRVITIK